MTKEQSKFTQCIDCIYSETVVNEGDEYNFLNPNGDIVIRKHNTTVHVCRYNPPITGEWPQVTNEDWCSKGVSSGHN